MKKPPKKTSDKIKDLERNKEDGQDQFLTTNQGLRINDDQNSLKAGDRGSSLLEDFILREKITHFDHERIPERIVHARGSGAHGYFQVYEPMKKYTKAGFLNDPDKKTPVFVRISTVAGSTGSTDLARDVRGFSVKFYTDEGIYDLVGNNMPVFFIQDAMKFPDLIHAVKPEPDKGFPQAASAHDTFWDFISLMPESAHMIMWVMSDRAIPRSLRMIEGFGVHTFRFVNDNEESHFVKFHWKPLLGTHSVLWDEAVKISGADSDFHRRDLHDAIENGDFPEWELGVQIIPEADEHKFDFDLLDATKLVPEEEVPVQRIGKMTLNRNPDNFFAETEQVAFHPGHLVPGIEFSNDPLLQGRLFSYTDTQLSRLGSPNFHEIPINRSVSPIHNNQRDGHMRQEINIGQTHYHPNSLGGGCPFQAKISEGGFSSYGEKIDAFKIRERSESFKDHFSQATLFFNSQSEVEKQHIVNALSFELGKVNSTDIRKRMVGILSQIDDRLAKDVSLNLGMSSVPEPERPINKGVPADADQSRYEPTKSNPKTKSSEALSLRYDNPKTIKTRNIAILCSDGVDDNSVEQMKSALKKEGAYGKIIATHSGEIKTANGKMLKVDDSFLTGAPFVFDAFYVPGGNKSIEALLKEPAVKEFLEQGFKHLKPIAADSEAKKLLDSTNFADKVEDKKAGVILSGSKATSEEISTFIGLLEDHRVWSRMDLM